MLNGFGPSLNSSSKSKSRPRSNLGMSLNLDDDGAKLLNLADDGARLRENDVSLSVKGSLGPKGSGSGKSMGGSKSNIFGGCEIGGVGIEESGRDGPNSEKRELRTVIP